jgi:hypothetical protein
MQVAVPTIVLKVGAGRNYFGVEEPGVLLALHLAKVGRLPVPEQRFEQGVFFLAADVDLDVAAAGRPAGMVGGATVGGGTRIGVRGYWQ